MLQFKRPNSENIDSSPRWKVGLDRRTVAAYVTLALFAGFAGGFLTARNTTRRQRPAAPPAPEARPLAQTPADNSSGEFYRVTRIIRADTLAVESIGQVRMIGIETPDGKTPAEVYGIHGQRALSFVEKAALDQDVRLEFDPTGGRTKDEAGQTLAYVYTRNGTLLNAEMVKQGLALVRPEESRLANDFREYERDAMQAMRGIWGSSSGYASTAASATPAPTQTSADDRPKKLAPLPPSALGVNIPALSGPPITPDEPSVWVSADDKMYHKLGCEFLTKKKHALGLSQAKSSGYTACSRCYASTVLKAP
jgi:endonuclease YncB( thermonuclease family)